jgi:hypothetical protein
MSRSACTRRMHLEVFRAGREFGSAAAHRAALLPFVSFRVFRGSTAFLRLKNPRRRWPKSSSATPTSSIPPRFGRSILRNLRAT